MEVEVEVKVKEAVPFGQYIDACHETPRRGDSQKVLRTILKASFDEIQKKVTTKDTKHQNIGDLAFAFPILYNIVEIPI